MRERGGCREGIAPLFLLSGDTPEPHVRSFLLTAEEKEPKKTATPKPLHRGFNLFRGKTLYIKILVWLAKPVPYRASHGFGDYAQLVAIYLIPCLNTEGVLASLR